MYDGTKKERAGDLEVLFRKELSIVGQELAVLKSIRRTITTALSRHPKISRRQGSARALLRSKASIKEVA